MNLPPKLDPKNQTPTDPTITKTSIKSETGATQKKKELKKNLGIRVERKLRWGKAAERERERRRRRPTGRSLARAKEQIAATKERASERGRHNPAKISGQKFTTIFIANWILFEQK
jgi:hypothetical protein